MFTNKKIISYFAIAVIALTLAVETSAQNDGAQGRRLRFVTGAEAALNQPLEIGVPVKTSVALEKSELASSEDARLLEKEAFDLINLRRLEKGLKELRWNARIADLARQHSENMAVNGFFSHMGLNGNLVDNRAVEFGINDWRAIGENIAFNKGFANPTSFAVERWMMSDGHRNNLLDRRWTESGLGIAITTDGKYFFTQIFMTKD